VELDGTVEAWFENIEANGMSFVAPGFVYIFKGDASGNGGAVDIKAPTRVATANVGGPKGRGARYVMVVHTSKFSSIIFLHDLHFLSSHFLFLSFPFRSSGTHTQLVTKRIGPRLYQRKCS
jgi:hypothetical protein